MIPDPSPPFEFEPSGEIRQRIRTLIDQATQIGRRTEAIQAFAKIFEFLTQEPRDWGDPIRNYRGVEVDRVPRPTLEPSVRLFGSRPDTDRLSDQDYSTAGEPSFWHGRDIGERSGVSRPMLSRSGG